MAKSTKRQPPRSFYEVVIQGPPKMVRGFLGGLVLGAGHDSVVIFHHDACIQEESRHERLIERIGLQHRDINAVVDRHTCDLLRKNAQRIESEIGLRVASTHHVRSAEFSFDFQAYARRYGVEIKGILTNLTAGLRLEDFTWDEQVHPGAEGIEAYAPVHDYEIKGSGKIVGRIDLLVEARCKLDRHPLVNPGHIQLKLA